MVRRLCIYSIVVSWSLFSGVNAIVANNYDKGLVGHWKLDERSGITAKDSSGYGNHGTLMGNGLWVEGMRGGALDVSKPGSYVDCGAAPSLDIYETMTLCLWLKIHPTEAGQFRPYLTKGRCYGIRQHPSRDLEFYLNDTSTISVRHPLPLHAQSGEWLYVIGMYDGEKLELYFDSALVAHTDYGGLIDITGAPVHIAHNVAYSKRVCNAVIDDVHIFNRSGANPYPPFIPQPHPKDYATDVLRDIRLNWPCWDNGYTYDVYLGQTSEDVNNASQTNPLDVLVGQDLDVDHYAPVGPLEFGATYYWRVDEVNRVLDKELYKGRVWRFTVEPFSIPIETDITATASSRHSLDMSPDNTINGSGLNMQDQHGTKASHMWLSAHSDKADWIQCEFAKAYKLHEMWVWNHNQVVEPYLGLGAKDVMIEISLDGVIWQAIDNVPQFTQASGSPRYTPNTIVDLGWTMAKYVKLSITDSWGPLEQVGLSEVRFLHIPTFAREPKPKDGDETASIDVELTWRAGREADYHNVYLAPQDEPLTLIETTSDNSVAWGPLDCGTAYVWRVDEVNEMADPVCHTGDLWTFTTAAYRTIEDFESYADYCNFIFMFWLDGLGTLGSIGIDYIAYCENIPPYRGNGTGSIVGHFAPPFVETRTVHSGRLSLPFYYDNTFPPYYSEIQTVDFYLENDWTRGGVDTLSLFFHGPPLGARNDPNQVYHEADVLYLALKDHHDHIKTVIHPDPRAVLASSWQEWRIPLGEFSAAGLDLSAVKNLILGVADPNGTEPGGAGTVYIDDIRLGKQRIE